MRIWNNSMGFVAPAPLALAVFVGCDKKDAANKPAAAKPQQAAEQPKPATQPLIPWHRSRTGARSTGVPESICTRCKESLTAGFQAKSDWCAEHKLPDSQCFKHHPELQQTFAAAYQAKYGKEPPPMTAE